MSEKFFVAPQAIGPLQELRVKQELGAGAGRIPAWPIAGWDPEDGLIKLLNLGVLVDPLVLAEAAYAVDKLDTRDGIAVTVPATAVATDVVTGELEVPAGEVWFVNRMQVVCPAADATGSVSFNIRVSPWPKTAALADKAYWPVNQVAMGVATNIELPAQGELGRELRLEGGDILTLILLVTVNFTVAKVFNLNVFGRQGKKILA